MLAFLSALTLAKFCRLVMLSFSILFFCSPCFATVYDIGPGQAYTTIGSFNWGSLQPGDTVQIHAGTYHEILGISARGTLTQPIRVVGIPDPSTGALPVLDGQNAVVGAGASLQYEHGTPTRGVLDITPAPNASVGYKPAYIEIANLIVKNGYGGTPTAYSISYPDGTTGVYNASAASIYIVASEHITITNCVLTGSSDGFFVSSGGDGPDGEGTEATESRDITLQYSKVYGNGNPGSEFQHNIYTEGSGMTFQYNYLGGVVAGSGGINLKDRSAGTVIRYNWIESGAHMLDLVDPQGSANVTVNEPSFQYTMVYGNVFHNTSTYSMIHYGGDQGNASTDRKGTLYFYNNTVVIEGDQSSFSQTMVLDLQDNNLDPSPNEQLADVRNNILYVTSVTSGQPATTMNLTRGAGVATFAANWVSPGWYAAPGETSSSSVVGSSNFFVDPNNNPSFTSVSGNLFTLQSTSNAIDKGVAQASAVTSNPLGQNYSVVEQYVKDQSKQARQVNGTALDFGAFEAGSAGPCGYALYPASATVPYTGTTSTMEVTADAGCSWTASSNASWLSIVSGGSGSGTGNGSGVGNVEYSVASNPGIARSGSLMIGGQNFTVSQLAYDAMAPTVSITAPTNGATVSGNTVTLSASASDNIAVAGVQFTVDGSTYIGDQITTPPYTVSWNSTQVAPGTTHTISAIVTDTSGNTATATPVTVTVETPNNASATYNGATDFVSNQLTAVQTGAFTFEGDIVPAGDGSTNPQENGLFALSSGTVGALTDMAVITLFDTDGVIRVRNGGAYSNIATVNYVAGHTYHVRMVVNLATHTYDVYVTPQGGIQTQIASAYAFRSEQASVTQLAYWDLVANGNSISANNVAITASSQMTAAPTFNPASGNYSTTQTVTISSTTPSAAIYYTTDGNTPTTGSTLYSNPITVSESKTVKAIAIASGLANSSVSSATYTIGAVAATPAFSPAGGIYNSAQIVTISSSTPSATIHYTTNGSTPTTSSTLYTGPITVSATETVKAIATATGYSNSSVSTASYTITAMPIASTPTFSPAGGTYTSTQTVTISTSTPSATIYYTTDGSSPTPGSNVYSGAVTVSTSETLKAIAVASGYMNSSIGSVTYTIHSSGGSGPVYVQQCNNYTPYDASISCTLTGIHAGDTLVIGLIGGDGTAPVVSSGTVVHAITDSSSVMEAYVVSNTSADNMTVTFNRSSPGKIWLSVSEYSNVDPSSPLDGTGSGGCTSYCTSVSSSSFATTSDNDMLWSTCIGPGGASITPGTLPVTWTSLPTPNGSGYAALFEYGPAGVAGTYYGQCINGTGIISLALRPSTDAVASTPTFTPAGGTYTSAQTVTISTSTPSATVYYTTNGTTPTTSSNVYSGAITVSSSETVKAIAVASGYMNSSIGSVTYTINSSAGSGPAYVQQCNNYVQYDVSISCTLTGVKAGDTLVIGLIGGDGTAPVASSGTAVHAITDPSGVMEAYVLSNTSAGNITVTFNQTSPGRSWLSVSEYSDVDPSSPLDGTGSGACTSYCTSVSSSSFATTSNNDMLWSTCIGPGGASITAGTLPVTWTPLPTPNGSGYAALFEYGPAGAAGTYYGQCINGTAIISLALK